MQATCKHRLNRKSQISSSAPVKRVPVQKNSLVKGKRDAAATGGVKGVNSGREELSVEGHKVGGVSYNGKPTLAPAVAPKRRGSIPKDSMGQAQYQSSTSNVRETPSTRRFPSSERTRAPISYTSSNPGQKGVPASSSNGLSVQGRNGLTKTGSLPSPPIPSPGDSGRNLESTRAGVARYPATGKRRVDGMKITSNDHWNKERWEQ